MKNPMNNVRAISFGEILTSRGLYVVLIVFAAAALGKFLFTGQSVNSTASLNSTLSQAEATKIKLAWAQVTALANLPGNLELSESAIKAQFPTNATGSYDLSGTEKKIVVGVLGSNQTSNFDGSSYKNDSTVFSAIDRGATTRVLVSNTDLWQDIVGYDYAGTGAVLGAWTAHFYVSNIDGRGLVASSGTPIAPVVPVQVIENHNLPYNTFGGDGWNSVKTWFKILVKWNYTLESVTKNANVTATVAYIQDLSDNVIATANFSWDVATFNTPLSTGGYYVVVDNGGANYTYAYNSATTNVYPVSGDAIDWIGWRYSTFDNMDSAFSIDSIKMIK